MTKSKMIVIWGSEDILSSSIEHFLGVNEDWKVVSLSNKEDLYALKPDAETAQMDIVFIRQKWGDELTDLAMYVLQNHLVKKVITISLENNTVDVYSKQKILVRQTSDLLAVIENEI